MAKRKSWQEKLYRTPNLPRVEPLSGKLRERWGEGTLLIPSPTQVLELMQQVPEGRLITTEKIREVLARRHGATLTCPLTTGIFVNLVARASEEAYAETGRWLAPYWRTLKAWGALNPRYPGGQERQRARLEQEGHRVETRHRVWRVVNWQRVLWVPEE